MIKGYLIKFQFLFAAGCFGGLVNRVFVWAMGASGLTEKLGMQINPGWDPSWVYLGVVWGGIWALLFILPFFPDRKWSSGILLSLGPSAVQLFVVLAQNPNAGMMGLELGGLTPLFVLVANLTWGLATVAWIKAVTP